MGLGDLFKSLLGGSTERIDYAELSDDDLLRLSASRGTLTADARAALDQELDRRDLRPKTQPAPEPEPPPPSVLEDVPPIEGDPVLVLERRGVVLRTQARASVLLMMPIWDAEAPYSIDRPEMKSNVTEILVMNETEGGWLPVAYASERLTIKNQFIFALDHQGSVDRPFPGLQLERTVVAEPVGETLEIGHLSLERTPFRDVVIASWNDNDLAIVIGPRIPPAFFGQYEGITHVIGGLLAPQSDADRAIYSNPELYQQLETVILLLDSSGVTTWPATMLPALGVTVQAVGREEGAEADELAMQMKLAIDAGDWEKAAALFEELSAREIEDVIDGLTIERNLEAAKRVLGMALGSEDWKDSGRIHFLAGVGAFQAKDLEAAVAAYRRALEGDEPDHRALASLSAICRKQRDHREAILLAQAALVAMPEDAIALAQLIAAHASAGQLAEAKSVIDRNEPLLGSAGVLEWRSRVEQWPVEEVEELPYLADKTYQIGCIYASSGRVEQAEALLVRCLELMPTHLEATLELGVLLSSSDREEEAIALYDRVLARAPGIAFVRFNRANCLIRRERIPEAIAELQRVAREVPEWDAPKEVLTALGASGSASGS